MFTYLKSKSYKIDVYFEKNSLKVININGAGLTYIYLNDRLIQLDELNLINAKDLAYMKIYGPHPPFFAAPLDAPCRKDPQKPCAALLLYTKNAKEYANNVEGIKQTQIIGYTKTKDFYKPTKDEVKNIHYLNQGDKTLYWNNNIELNKEKPNYTINFYAPMRLKKYTIIVEGMDDWGRLVYIKKQVER